jgi:hypothetical protein
MISTAILLLAIQAGTGSIPDRTPVSCLDSTGEYQPVMRTDFGRLKSAFAKKFNFTATLTQTSATMGTLTFRGGQRNAETISYTVKPRSDSIALVSMRVRLRGVTQNLQGNDMCWQTFSIVNV